MAHRFQVEPAVVTKVDPGAEDGFVGVKDVELATGTAGNRRLRPDISGLLRSKKIATWSKLLLGFRITAFVFCLVSFSVLAADKKQGWALDSFYFYKEFRYSLSVNVIGFAYSGLQMCDLVVYLNSGKHIVEHQLRGYLTFAVDQILTYLLMSASSSAATRAYDWESNWGEDKFPYMANASVALSLVAFVAFALASLVSGSIIVRFR
ncbi:CASP-like protein 4A1 [Abrus precatorius]|uniref:CASP-like protein n=1 Tax=Abrus precatorius TaxID=3816 RepID=A0A8B8L8P3_ABRPR|nr:CASP-like protein 4A1 [Abrus precatorius]